MIFRRRWMSPAIWEHFCGKDNLKMDKSGKISDKKLRQYIDQIEKILKEHESVQDIASLVKDDRILIHVLPELAKASTSLNISWGEYRIFNSLIYSTMTGDSVRNARYKAAINRNVPGKIVLDIGTGQDMVQAAFCVEAGASKVYAIEENEIAFEKAQEKIRQMGWEGRVILIKGDSTQVDIPEKVDVCVSEIIGCIGSSEGTVPILNDARERFLKSDGIMIPGRCVTKIAAVQLPEDLAQSPSVHPIAGQLIREAFEKRGYSFDVRLVASNFPLSGIVSEEAVFEDLDFSEPVSPEQSSTVSMRILKDTLIDGFLLWVNLYPDEDSDFIDTLRQNTSWAPLYLPVFCPCMEMRQGDLIHAVCHFSPSEDGLRPDYAIHGHIERHNGERIEFSYDAPLYEKRFKHNLFYQKLFSEPGDEPVSRLPVKRSTDALEFAEFIEKGLPDAFNDYGLPEQKRIELRVSKNLPLAYQGKIDSELLRENDDTPIPDSLATIGNPDYSIHKWLAVRAAQTPEAVALVERDRRITYAELDRRAGLLAGRLLNHGVEPDTLVGMGIRQSIEMVIAIYGILKAGGAFLPLDPAYPKERLSVMLQDSGVSIIVTRSLDASRLPDGPFEKIEVDEPSLAETPESSPGVPVLSCNLACCLYTSGSTGMPKGVLIEHGALVQNALSMASLYDLTASDRVLLFASMNYVAALEQLFMPLITGASVVIREAEIWNAVSFPEKMRKYGITCADLSPEYWHTLLKAWKDRPELVNDMPLRLVILGGDAVRVESVELWRQTLPSVRLMNAYGMTETPVTSTLYEILLEGDLQRVPVGLPTPGKTVHILDEFLRPVSDGKTGEIVVGGKGLARGYLNRPDLTAERFISAPSGRMYRTGDMGRRLPNGIIEHMGRMDRQEQIRGFRVELDEVELTLRQYPGVCEAAVITHGTGAGKKLIGYVVPDAPELKDFDRLIPECREFLTGKLPGHMLPDRLIVLDAMPLTPNGKTDRMSLPIPDDLGGGIPDMPLRVTLSGWGSPDYLRLTPMTRKPPGPGEVEIAVSAAGISFRDIMTVLGQVADEKLSDLDDFQLGFECAGTISALGIGVPGFSVGDEVMSEAKGSLADFVNVEAVKVVHKPACLSMPEAAAVPVAFSVAYHSLFDLADIRKGERILIHSAASDVGLAALKMAKLAGAEVFATADSDNLAFLKSQGAEHVMPIENFDSAVTRMTSDEGVHVLLNSLGGELIEKGFSVMAAGGRFVEIGMTEIWDVLRAESHRPDVAYFPLDMFEATQADPTITPRILNALGEMFAKGVISAPPVEVFPLRQAAKAFRRMSQMRHVGKMVIDFSSNDISSSSGKAEISSQTPKMKLPEIGSISSAISFQKVKNLISEEIGVVLNLNTSDEIDPEEGFYEMGFNSLTIIELFGRLQSLFGSTVSKAVFFDHPTLNALANHLSEKMDYIDVKVNEKKAGN